MNKAGLAIALFVIAFIALIAWSTFKGPRYRVEVCMNFNGRTSCKTVSAKSADAALRAGVEGACADITAGVTETVTCGQTQPQSVKWLNRPR